MLIGEPTAHLYHLPPGIIQQPQPNWIAKTLSTYDNGQAEVILFYAPVPGINLDRPVQLITFRESGAVEQEVDLTVVTTDNPAAKRLNTTVVPHSHAVSYFPNGSVASITSYQEGELQGPLQTYYPNGNTCNLVEYQHGVLDGPFSDYYSNGILAAEGRYQHGQLSGTFTRYHPNSSKAATITYVNGLVEGEVLEWYDDGGVASRQFFQKGVLNDHHNTPAVTRYDRDHHVIEEQSFLAGQPHGLHLRYANNGQETYRQQYQRGYRIGLEIFKDDQGTIIGQGEYVCNLPVGDHYRKDPNSDKTTYLARYDAQGQLLQPIQEFYPNGNRKSQYQLIEGTLDGDYLEYAPEGYLKHHHRYDKGNYYGLQEDFYSDNSPKKRTSYLNGKRHGAYQEWAPNGQLIACFCFTNGDRNGPSKEWYDNGHKKTDLDYSRGQRHGQHQEWDSSGTLTLSTTYHEGLLDGLYQEWYPSGQQKVHACYDKGHIVGTEKSFFDNGQCERLAHYQEGLLQGLIQEWYSDGGLRTEGYYELGKPVGVWQLYHPLLPGQEHPKVARILSYSDGRYDDEQLTFYFDGTKQAVLRYSNGVLEGSKELWTRDGELIQQTDYRNGKAEGKHYENKPSGDVIIAFYHDNRLDGPYLEYYPPNAKGERLKSLEAHYAQGQYHGEVRSYDINGNKIASTHYKHGLKEGTAAIFSNGGSTILVATFVQDKRQGPSYEYYPSGVLKRQVRYVDDLKEGDEVSYHEDGNKAAVAPYRHGQLHGVSRSWNPDGVLTFESNYCNGMRHGVMNKYYDDGSPRIVQFFINDELVPGSKQTFSSQQSYQED